MRSLVVTRLSPFPPNAGVPLRVAANLAALAELGPVDVIIIGDKPAGEIPDYIDRVETFETTKQTGLAGLLGKFGPRHPAASELFSPEVEAAIERLGSGPGLIVLDEVWMAPYIDAARRTGRQTVYDSHNVETVLRREIVSVGDVGLVRRIRREMITAQVKRLERQLVTKTDQVWVCSEDDRQVLNRLFGPVNHIRVVPNGVNTATISPRAADEVPVPVPPQLEGDRPSIIFLGDLAYTPNEDGALYLLNEVMPALDHRPTSPSEAEKARVVLVGRRPTARLIETAADRDDAEVTGEVDEVMPYLIHGDLLAVTLRVGGGTRLKILEAMAAGLPIVTTSKGLEGIDAEHGVHLLIADTPQDLATAIGQVLADEALGDRLAVQARELVDRSYSWTAIARLIADASAELLPTDA